MTVQLNSKVPPFSAEATSSITVTNSTLSDRNTIFFFYPKDNTPGCTTESCEFAALYPDFVALNCQIFGISRDSLKSHENFKSKQMLPFELISDPDESLCSLFDVLKLKNMYGKQVMGVERSTFLINPQGLLTWEWRKVKAVGHAQAVLAQLRMH